MRLAGGKLPKGLFNHVDHGRQCKQLADFVFSEKQASHNAS
jgi:hypothetical protein